MPLDQKQPLQVKSGHRRAYPAIIAFGAIVVRGGSSQSPKLPVYGVIILIAEVRDQLRDLSRH
jgi:hypothetical protein